MQGCFAVTTINTSWKLSGLVDSTEDRLIVFYNFNEELTELTALVQDKPVSIVNGSIKDLSAYEEHENSITFVQYQAGAMGLNLQKQIKQFILHFHSHQNYLNKVKNGFTG